MIWLAETGKEIGKSRVVDPLQLAEQEEKILICYHFNANLEH